MNRSCAVCGREIRYKTLCKKCFEDWCPSGVYPLWVKELIRIQTSFDRKKANLEMPFTEVGRDLDGEKL